MSRRRPERALRRAVTGLARLHPDDVEAILATLEPGERARVDALVAGLAGRAPAAEAAPAQAEPEWVYESVSPWLLTRIDPDDKRAGRASRDFVLMTEAGREALRSAAEPFRKPAAASAGRNARSLLDQAWRALTRARA